VAGDGAREEGQGVDEGHGVAAPAKVSRTNMEVSGGGCQGKSSLSLS
jgi:hypothetical protein